MANKVTIGQVNVRVRPDTSGVYQETKRALDAIEKKLGAIEVEVKADTDSLNREVERARDSAQRQARRDAITFRVDLENDESIKRAIGQVRRELEKLSEDEFEIDLNHDALNEFLDDLNEQFDAPKVINIDYREGEAGLRALRREIEKISDEHHRIPFEFDTSEEGIRKALADVDEQLARQPMQLHVEPNVASVDKALREIDRRLGIDGSIKMEVATDEESLRRARHHLEELKEDYDDTTLDFHPEVSELAHRLAQGKLAWLARSRIVNLIPLVNSAAARKAETAITALAGVRLLRSTFDRVWDLVKNLDKNIPLIGSIALAVQGLSAWLLAAASNTFALAQSLAQIGPLALTLPGILGGLTVGIGAYIAVLQDFNEVLPEIGDSLSDLQDEMSSRFWEQSAEAVRSSWLRVLPPLRKGLLQTTDALSGWTNAMAESLGRHLPPTLPEMFDNLSRSIDIASKGADDFGRIIEILGRRGSEYLPRLARWFTDIQGNFANWLDTADRTGRLTRLIEQAIEQASQLGRVFYHTGGILADFAHAAELAGGTSLTDLANKLEQIHEVTSRPSFQAGLVRTFRAAHEAMDNIARVSGPRVHDFFVNLVDMMERNLPLVGETIGLLVGGIAEALSTDRFERGFNDFMRGLNSMARDLDPVWDDIGDGIGSVLSLAGDLATAFGPVLAAAFSLFSDVAQAVAPILGEIASILSARLVTVIETLHEPIIAVAEAFANLTLAAANVPGLLEGVLLGFLALRAIRPVVGILEGARRALAVFGIGGKGKGAAKGGGGLFGGLTRSLSRLGPMLARIAPMLLRLGGIVGIVGGTLISAYQESDRLRDALSRLWQAVVDAFEPVRQALEPLKEALSELLTTVMESVQQVGEALGIDIDISGIESFSQATGDLLALLVDYAIPGVAAFAEVLANLIAGTIMNWVIPAIQSLSAIISQFANWLSSVFIPEMQNVGAQIGIVWDWIRNKVSTVVSALVPIVAAGMAVLQGNWSKAWAIVRKLVSSAWNAIRSIVRGGMDGAKATVNNGLAAIVNWFRQRWNAAKAVVVNAIARIRGTITNGISAAANAVSSFLSRIVKIFRSGWSQAVSATSAGWARVVATIAKFIGRALSVIRSLPSQAAGIVRSGAGAMVSAGASLISGLVSGIRSAASRVASAARSVVSSAITAARKALQINSPSKVFIGIGRYTGQGFVEGLLSEESEVEKAGRRVAEAAEKGVKSVGDLSANSNLIIGTGDNRALPNEDRESLRAFIAAAEELSKRPVEAKVNGRVLWKTVKESEVKYG